MSNPQFIIYRSNGKLGYAVEFFPSATPSLEPKLITVVERVELTAEQSKMSIEELIVAKSQDLLGAK